MAAVPAPSVPVPVVPAAESAPTEGVVRAASGAGNVLACQRTVPPSQSCPPFFVAGGEAAVEGEEEVGEGVRKESCVAGAGWLLSQGSSADKSIGVCVCACVADSSERVRGYAPAADRSAAHAECTGDGVCRQLVLVVLFSEENVLVLSTTTNRSIYRGVYI